MAQDVKAIDFMRYVATPEFIAKWNDAKKGELICRMERAIGSLPSFESIGAMLRAMDEAWPGPVTAAAAEVQASNVLTDAPGKVIIAS